ncbi:MAG: D-2-hydroxyacid dehydrogenase [Candidatus Rokuibacteriota bacterium]|nr:MAG: D-2-hydroxyacid dehydrogenase [Candidatus Rokubacteria bacterium]
MSGPPSKNTVLLWLDEPGDYLRAAQEAGLASSVELLTTPLKSDPPDALLARADALLAWRPPARLAARAPRLRWIQSLTGGCEQWLGPDVPPQATLTCARGTHRVQMSEHILAGLFLCAKDLASIVLDQAERRWRRRINPTLAGATLGILGLGAIGAEVARLTSSLGMRVIGTKREPTPLPGVARVHPPAETARVLAESDYVLLLLPSTADTRGIVDKTALAAMKPSAFLLNFGRGDLVVDADLVAAVRERRIAGAVLDVFAAEPLPTEHGFWTTPGIVVLPHIGGLHPQRDTLVAALWRDNLARFVAGRPLTQVVDRARGY